MTKTEILSWIDSKIYAKTQGKIDKVSCKALIFNNNQPFKYKYFKSMGADYCEIILANQKCKDYLDKCSEDLDVLVDNREQVNAYLIRFLNKAKNSWAVLHLVPTYYWQGKVQHMIEYHQLLVHDRALVDEFINFPEQKLMKTVMIMDSMGV